MNKNISSLTIFIILLIVFIWLILLIKLIITNTISQIYNESNNNIDKNLFLINITKTIGAYENIDSSNLKNFPLIEKKKFHQIQCYI